MTKRLTFLLTALVLAFAAPAALAQTAPPQPAKPAQPAKPTQQVGAITVAPVIVQAPAPPKVIERQSYKFTQKLVRPSPNNRIDQLTRWGQPVCPKVVGLIPQQEQDIQARIDEVAAELKLSARKPGCTANIEIVFSDRPQAVMDQVFKRRPQLLGYWYFHEGKQMKTVTRPIQAWRTTSTLGTPYNNNGLEVNGAPAWVFGPGAGVIDDAWNTPPMPCSAYRSFVSDCRQSLFANVFIVVDSRLLGTNSLNVIADYLTLVALADPGSLDGCNDLPSVLDVLAKVACPGREAPDGLTPADAAYLTALYAADHEGKAWAEQGEIALRMARILIKANAAAK
jgi:hypothetical protein